MVAGPEHIVNYANAAFRSLVGVAIANPIGLSVAELLAPGDAPRLTALLERVARTGAAAEDAETGGQAEAGLHFSVSPDASADGKPGHLVVLVRRVTIAEHDLAFQHDVARRMTMSALRDQAMAEAAEGSRRRYRALVDASAQMVWTTNAAGEFTREQGDWNAFTGQAREEYSGRGWLNAIHPDDQEPASTAWDAALAARTPLQLEYRIRRHDGVYRWFAVRAVPIVEQDGEVREWVGSEADITERIAADREREELFQASQDARIAAETARAAAELANSAKDEFLAAMSHELRTPLNAIGGYIQLVDMGVHGPVTQAQREALRRAMKSERHLMALVNDVLNFAKIESGSVTFDIQDLPLAVPLGEVEDIVRPLLEAKPVDLDVAVGNVVVRADEERLKQIILNLLSNAIKFTAPGGRIEIDAEDSRAESADGEGLVFLRVSDTGIGIPREKQEAIFDPFVQVHRNLANPIEGTGLGLAISRDLARGMGGDLRVRSTEGKGSVFTLSLPAAK